MRSMLSLFPDPAIFHAIIQHTKGSIPPLIATSDINKQFPKGQPSTVPNGINEEIKVENLFSTNE